MKILIGHDGSSYADDAVDDLRWAGLPSEVEALVVIVEEEPGVTEVLKAALRLRSYFPSWQVHTKVVDGRPATMLIRRAREWGADLVVVGSHGRTALGRLILGSVSMEVAAGAHCSVRIGRDYHEGSGLKLLVALDSSLEAQEALRLILQRSWPPGTQLRVVGVGEGVSFPSTVASQIRGETSSNQKFQLLSNGDLKIYAGVVKGPIEQVLMEEAHEWQADCIVIGVPSEEQVRELAANTKCSLEIIRLPVNRKSVNGNEKG